MVYQILSRSFGILHIFASLFSHEMKWWRSNSGNKIAVEGVIQAFVWVPSHDHEHMAGMIQQPKILPVDKKCAKAVWAWSITHSDAHSTVQKHAKDDPMDAIDAGAERFCYAIWAMIKCNPTVQNNASTWSDGRKAIKGSKMNWEGFYDQIHPKFKFFHISISPTTEKWKHLQSLSIYKKPIYLLLKIISFYFLLPF